MPEYDVTVVVPTFNEAGNIAALVAGLTQVLPPTGCRVLFVDDSTDDTPHVIVDVAVNSTLPVMIWHRIIPTGGLAGAVRDGLELADSTYVVVMDGDLQHPVEMVPVLLDEVRQGADLAVASRYCGAGDSSGLSSSWRHTVSSLSTTGSRVLFPRRVGAKTTDPMTGFFALRRDAVDLTKLHPRGFKILLEILASQDLSVTEVPFVFGRRVSGESKASWRNGLSFLHQLLSLRVGPMARFAGVGAIGFGVNLAVMAVLLGLDVHYLVAAVLATQVAIISNFVMQERFVFRHRRHRTVKWRRFAMSAGYNNIDTLARIPLLILAVSGLGMGPLLAQALTLAVSFFARFYFTSKVVYRQIPTPVENSPATAA